MNTLLKEKQKILSDTLKDLNYKIDIQTNKIETQEKYIRDIKSLTDENKKEYESRIADAQSNIEDLQKLNSEASVDLDSKIETAENALKTLNDEKQDLLLRSQDIKTQMGAITKRAKFYDENDTCPECQQTLVDDLRKKNIDECKHEARGLASSKKAIGERGVGVEAQISLVTEDLKDLRLQVSEIANNNKEISSLQKTIGEYQRFWIRK